MIGSGLVGAGLSWWQAWLVRPLPLVLSTLPL